MVRGGAEYAVTAALSYLPAWLALYTHHILLVCKRGAPGRGLSVLAPTRIAAQRDVERLAGLENLTPETIERRLGRGDTCVMALEDGRVLASAWAATGTRHLIGLGRVFDIPRDAFYVYDTFTEPIARRRGLATSVYQELFDHFAAQGRTTAVAAVEVLNDLSLRAHARWGFVPVGRARMICLLALRLALCSEWPKRSRPLHLAARWHRPPVRPA